MNPNTFAKLVAALSEYPPPSSSSIYPTSAPPFDVHPFDYANKPLGPPTVKQENFGTTDCSFSGNTGCLSTYPSNVTIMGDSEQVPMDDFDPMETFNFWEGDTLYTNPELDANLDANCGLLTNLPAESEMAELQDFMIRDELIHDNFPHLGGSDPAHNPTLAELNSCNDPLFDCSVESSFLSEDSGYLLSPDMLSKSVPGNDCFAPSMTLVSNVNSYINNINIPLGGNFNETKNQSMLSSSCPVSSQAISCAQYFGACDERLLLCPQNSPASDTFMPKQEPFSADSQLTLPGTSKLSFASKRLRPHPKLSTSAPLDVCSSVESSPCIKSESPSSCSSKNADKSLSNFSALSLSNDDESGSYFDSDHDDDDDDGFSSEDDMYQYDSDDAYSTSWPPAKEAKGQPRRNRFFWQYNLQSRGLKTQNLLPLSEETDPYVLNDVKDPVFSEECTLPVKHSGKARKGDGNDLTPNPRKLYSIGMELKKLNKMIYNLTPANEFSSHGKPLSRKEKNKLASRVCRLKKKAQHEANKIKLYGLQQEHKRLLRILYDVKQLIAYKIEHFQSMKAVSCFQKLENYLALHEPGKIAGNTTEFVNEVLSKVSKGDADGGLDV